MLKRAKRANPTAKAVHSIKEGKDPEGFDIKYISEVKGYGVFTSKLFQKADFLLEYAGDLLCKEEADLQEEKYLKQQRNALYPRCYMYFFKHNDKTLCIDATKMCGRAGSLVNDSDKDANCTVKKVVVDGRCHLALFAKADIDMGAELLYDYGDEIHLWWRKHNYNELAIDGLVEKHVWAKLPGIPKTMKWPVQVTSMHKDQNQANVYCMADDRIFRVSLDDIECISHKEWEDIGIECLKKKSAFLKRFRHDLSWARGTLLHHPEDTAAQHPQHDIEHSTNNAMVNHTQSVLVHSSGDEMVQSPPDTMVKPTPDNMVQPTQDAIVHPSPDAIVQPPQNTMVQPAQDAIVQPPQDAMAQPAQDSIVQPPPDAMVKPTPDNMVQPTQDAIVHPSPDAMVQPAQDVMVQRAQDAMVQPAQDAIVHPSPDTMAQPAQNTMSQPAQNTMVQPAQDAIVQPTQDAMAQPAQNTLVQPTQNAIVHPSPDAMAQPAQNTMSQPAQNTMVQPAQNTMVQPAQDAIVQPTRDAMAQPAQNTLVQPTQNAIVHPSPDAMAQPAQNTMSQPAQNTMVQPAQDAIVQPTQDAMLHPSPGTAVQFTPDATVQPSQDTVVQKSQDANVQPAEDAHVHPSQDAMVQPSQYAMVQSSKDAMVQPSQYAMVQPSQDAMVQPPPDAMVQPLQDAMVQPPPDAMVQSSQDAMVQPPPDAMVQPPSDAMVQPPSDAMVQPSKDAMVQPPSDAMVQPSKDAMVQPPSDAMVQSSQDAMVQPAQNVMVQTPPDALVQPAQNVMVEPLPDAMVPPSQDTTVQPSPDANVQSSPHAMVQSSPDTMVPPLPDAMRDVLEQPSQDAMVQPSQDENRSDSETDSDKVKDPDYVVTDDTSDEYDSFSKKRVLCSFEVGQKRMKRFTKKKHVKKHAVHLNPTFKNTFMDKANFVEDSALSHSDTNMPYSTKPLHQSLMINDSCMDDADITNSDSEMSDCISLKNGLSSNLYPNVYILKRGEKKEGCKQIYDKKNYCTFCEKEISSKISRHLLTVHKDRTRVSELFLLPKKSKERQHGLELLANEGNFKHNINVLRKKEGCLVVARRDGYEEKRPTDYLPCEYCKKFTLRTSLWWHNRNCSFRTTGDKANLDENETSNNAVRHGQHLLYSAVLEETDSLVVKMLSRMNNDAVKEIVEGDSLIKRYAALRVDSLGEEEDQKINDMYRVSQGCRTLARLILEAKKMRPEIRISLDYLVRPDNFDLVVECTKALSLKNDNPALTLGRFMGNLLNHVVQIKVGHALRLNDDKRNEDASKFKKLMEAEWNYRVNSACLKRMNAVKRTKVQTIPLTDDLKKLVTHIQTSMATNSMALTKTRLPCHWTDLAKLTMCRLILFNKRRRAEVKDLKVCDYLQRPNWKDEDNGEFALALSEMDRVLADRMDMVISAGKSRKNVDAYVILPPDAKAAIDMLIRMREEVGIPQTNPYIFARLNADTPFSGNTEMNEIVSNCPGLQYPERISSTALRKYIATVSQILDMTTNEFEMLANHLGHDVKTHKENYRLSHSTVELTKVSHLLLAVESGQVNKWKGKKLEDITIDELPVVYEEEDVEEDVEVDVGEDVEVDVGEDVEVDVGEDVEMIVECQGCSGDTNEGSEVHRPHKRRPWKQEETLALRKKFKTYLDTTNTKKISVHSADLVAVQKTCPSLQLRTLGQIRAKLNNIKLGKST